MNYLNDYITFDNTDELNAAVYLHIRNNTHLLNETDRKAFKTIARYAVKYDGVAHLKAMTIANLIEKSEKTARRVIAKLEGLGIVQKVATTRKVNGGTGANIIVILPAEERKQNVNTCGKQVANTESSENESDYSLNDSSVTYSDQSIVSSREVSEKPTESNTELRKNESEPSYFIKLFKGTYTDTLPSIPADALQSALPPAIYTAMAPFFNAEDLYRYYGLLLKAKRNVNPSMLFEEEPEPYVEAFHAVMLKYKQGIIRNLEKYMYVSFVNAAEKVNCRLNRDTESVLAYNWLEDVV